jgi:hypothetical protein
MDCSSVLQTVTELLEWPELASNDAFVHLVVEQVAGPVLKACNVAASENLLFSLPMRPAVVSLVSHTAALENADIVSIIENQSPSSGFLCRYHATTLPDNQDVGRDRNGESMAESRFPW